MLAGRERKKNSEESGRETETPSWSWFAEPRSGKWRVEDQAPGRAAGRGHCASERNGENFNECRCEQQMDLCGQPWKESSKNLEAVLLLE